MIELLIVVAIIALLAAMLLPALQRAKLAAKIAVCISTERQLYLGLASYCGDNDGRVPPHNTTGCANACFVDWGGRPCVQIMGSNTERLAAGGPYGGYMGLGHVLGGGYCGPSDNIKGVFEPTCRFPWWPGMDTPANFQANYAFLWKTYRLNAGGNGAPSVVWSAIGYDYRGWIPGTDAGINPRIDQMGTKAAIWDYYVNWDSQMRTPQTHNNGYNVCFYDGHVSAFPDSDAQYTLQNVYWSEAAQLLTKFEQRQ